MKRATLIRVLRVLREPSSLAGFAVLASLAGRPMPAGAIEAAGGVLGTVLALLAIGTPETHDQADRAACADQAAGGAKLPAPEPRP